MRYGQGDHVYEVFAQFGVGKSIELVGTVRAADPELAWHAAKESYTRRERCTQLWVAPRSAFFVSDTNDGELLMAGRRMDFRGPAYPGSLRRAREERNEMTVEGSP